MKILYLITGLGLGGAEKVVANLADHMHQRGHEVKVAYLTGDISVRPKVSDVEIIYLGLKSPKNIFSASRKYKKLIKEYQPDVVHAHMVHANIFARLARLMCKIPKLICTAHNSNEGGKIRMLAYRYTNWLSDFNTNVSQEATDSLIQKGAFDQGNLHTVYNGIDLSKFYPDENSSKTLNQKIEFLSVGRFNEQKDYPNLLHAIAQVIQRNQNVHFNIAGDGELRPTIEALIEQLGIGQYVTLLGRRDDVPDLMRQADCFVLSSKYEGLPTVLLEAIACGLFVIATDCGGSKEILNNNGYLIPSQNHNILAEKILDFINLSEDEQDKNNIEALRHVQKTFDLENIINIWLALYEK